MYGYEKESSKAISALLLPEFKTLKEMDPEPPAATFTKHVVTGRPSENVWFKGGGVAYEVPQLPDSPDELTQLALRMDTSGAWMLPDDVVVSEIEVVFELEAPMK